MPSCLKVPPSGTRSNISSALGEQETAAADEIFGRLRSSQIECWSNIEEIPSHPFAFEDPCVKPAVSSSSLDPCATLNGVPSCGQASQLRGIPIFSGSIVPSGRMYLIQWIGLRENLQETHGFLPSNIGLSCKFSHHPILWLMHRLMHCIHARKPWQHMAAMGEGNSACWFVCGRAWPEKYTEKGQKHKPELKAHRDVWESVKLRTGMRSCMSLYEHVFTYKDRPIKRIAFACK